MPFGPNKVEEAETLLQSSVNLPLWMLPRLDEVARRTFSSRSQVIRKFLAEGLERDASRSAEAEVA